MSITYYDGVFVALGIENVMRMRQPYFHLWPVPALQYFPTLCHKRHDFSSKKKMLLNTRCVFRFSVQLLSNTFLILRRNKRDMTKKMQPILFFI
jgi:hypothetical protein